MNNNRNDTILIDLKDLLVTVMKKWALMLLAGLVLAGLVFGREKSGQTQAPGQVTYESLAANLTPAEARAVEEDASLINTLNAQIEDQEKYQESAAIMELDPDNMTTYSTLYAVRTTLPSIEGIFGSQLLTDEDYAAIAKTLKIDQDKTDIKRLVNIETNQQTSDAQKEDQAEQVVIQEDGQTKKTLFLVVQIYAGSSADGDQLTEIIEDAIDRHADQMEQAGIHVEVSLVKTSVSKGYNQKVADIQKNVDDTMNQLISSKQDFERNYMSSLTQGQRDLYDFLQNPDRKTVQGTHGISKKKVAIGFAAGVFLVALLYSCLYVLGDSVKTEEETELLAGRPVIGKIVSDAKKEKKANEAAAMIAERIRRQAESQELNRVILQPFDPEKDREFVSQIRERTVQPNLQVESGDVLNDPEAYLQLDAQTLLIPMIRLHESSRKKLRILRTICGETDAVLGGEIVID